jgi:membrane protein YqaA with SNARE-associated domain
MCEAGVHRGFSAPPLGGSGRARQWSNASPREGASRDRLGPALDEIQPLAAPEPPSGRESLGARAAPRRWRRAGALRRGERPRDRPGLTLDVITSGYATRSLGLAGEAAGPAVAGSVAGASRPPRLGRAGAHGQARHSLGAAATRATTRAASQVAPRHGIRAVLIARLLPLARTFISLPAGAKHVRLLPFVALTTIGCALWATALVLTGLLPGRHGQASAPRSGESCSSSGSQRSPCP